MAIRASAAKQIEALVADLDSTSAVAREAAIARLTVIGARAVERLLASSASNSNPIARAAVWRTLEAIRDRRALEPAIGAMNDADQRVAAAALGVVRAFVPGAHGAIAVDRLTALALDRQRPESLRLAALRALEEVGASALAPLRKALANDPSLVLRAEAATGSTVGDPLDATTRAAEQGLGDDPDALRHAIVRVEAAVALPILLRIVERARERESSEPSRRRGEWARVRATAHLALARRGSRLALYDLRESLAGTSALVPVECLTALTLIGDRSCLEPIASAYARSSAPIGADRDWWRDHLTDAFRTIVAREQITRRHAVMKKIQKRWRGVLDEMAKG